MFTGIITAIGHIKAQEPLGSTAAHGLRLHINTPPLFLADVGLGDSIALNGACMTVTTLQPQEGLFTVDVSAESLARTCGLNLLGRVNLEKAMRPMDRLGGHIVSGHVDGVGLVHTLKPVGESWLFQIMCPVDLARFLAYKGSVTVQGVSLTINAVQDLLDGCLISMNLIPHTLAHTTLGDLASGASVNLEIDTVARYCERMLSVSGSAYPAKP
jgi:riboflavin synthase